MSLLVALDTFTDTDGKTHWAGISYADPSCDCVRKHPARWGVIARRIDTAGYQAAETRSRGQAGSTRQLARVRSLAPAPPRQIQRVARVLLTVRAQRDFEEQPYNDIVEQGGGLFGFFDDEQRALVIDDVTGRVVHSGESSCLVDTDYVLRMADRHAETTGYKTVGIWHTHPRVGATKASPADEALLESWWRHEGKNPFVGLILSKSDDVSLTWAAPTLTAHVVTRSPNGHPVIDRVPVKLEIPETPRWQLAK